MFIRSPKHPPHDRTWFLHTYDAGIKGATKRDSIDMRCYFLEFPLGELLWVQRPWVSHAHAGTLDKSNIHSGVDPLPTSNIARSLHMYGPCRHHIHKIGAPKSWRCKLFSTLSPLIHFLQAKLSTPGCVHSLNISFTSQTTQKLNQPASSLASTQHAFIHSCGRGRASGCSCPPSGFQWRIWWLWW